MRISSAFPSDYLKAADLQGRAVTVTMAHVSMEKVGNDQKPILYFQGKERGMVLNKTNANKISEMFGDDTDSWTGGKIVLYEAMVDFKGDTVAAIRVRLAPSGANGPRQAQPRPTPPPTAQNDDVIYDEVQGIWFKPGKTSQAQPRPTPPPTAQNDDVIYDDPISF